MRADGDVTFFRVQHHSAQAPGMAKRWVDSALDHLLFHELPYDGRRGEIGDRYRELLEQQSASTDLWQRYGIHGFERVEDARAALDAVRERCPDRKFRLVRRRLTREQ